MGLWNLDNPGRVGYDLAKYDGWAMVNIINDFLNNRDLTIEYDRVQMRKALLISSEVRRIQEGRRISV